MPLPDLIEIVPLEKPVRAEITVPGSKSITNRALILAALADGEVTLEGALWSEDTQVMTEALVRLGFEIKVEPDPDEFCNRRITVRGLGGRIPYAGTAEKPLELFVGNAGTAARFLAAMVCLGDGVYRLSGVPRMHERPQAALFKALRELSYRVDSENDKLPAVIHGDGPKSGNCVVSVAESSQFASALLLSGKRGAWNVELAGANEDELSYVEMTRLLCDVFPSEGGHFQIEPDASSGSYFIGGGWLLNREWTTHSSSVKVRHWPRSGWQIDQRFPDSLHPPFLGRVFSYWLRDTGETPKSMLSRRANLGDSIMTAIVLSPFAQHIQPGTVATGSTMDRPVFFASGTNSGSGLREARIVSMTGASVLFDHLDRLRVQECERVVALRTELTKCGAKVVEEGDTLTVYPSELHGAEIETYNDHRMAMCFAILGLKVPGIKLKNPACVKKTFPNFFQKLAAPPPGGLGAEIRDGKTGRKLGMDELFAE